ncbi:hypothetical protein PSHT_13634 [Puccinia striiformis]|uniref:DNA 3'-5' helicase n=1 Tax=Puccinia striiformis TaxID=27350 RepID=A0A2S4UP90_9BASI|nr:hypothetical protein PSHT_13634 [Puccinia striiformis]
MSRGDLFVHITNIVNKYYDEALQPLQMQTVINLVHRKNMKPVILVLNPLDTLGDNQVSEKKVAKIPAVNLTKMNMTPEIEKRVIRGDYGFVYLSPEVLLNNVMFRRVFFDKQFQSRLILSVVDEAHMVYIWGGIFRPSYGDLGARLLAAHGVPILLLSATCRPIAIDKILCSLKITPDNITLIKGELTRPEIRLIQVPMKSLLDSSDFNVLPNSNLTWQALKVIHEAREIRGGHHDPASTFARRFHSTTGDLDKSDIIDGFEEHEFPTIACTMALGLGQNWKRVQRVVHLGRGDPSSICQMIGRCGRGEDNPGLGIMLVETNRRKGKNNVSDFPNHNAFKSGYIPSDDDRMDALAITPVCLRIAFSIDNTLGYVPLSTAERDREIDNNFSKCLCSNFTPPPPKVTKPRSCINKKTGKKPLDGELENLAAALVEGFSEYHVSQINHTYSEFKSRKHFGIFDARRMALAYHNGFSMEQVEKVIGGEAIDGQMKFLQTELETYVKSRPFLNYLDDLKKGKGNVGTSKRAELARKQAKEKKAADTRKKAAEASKKAATLAKKTTSVPTRRSARTAENKRKNDNDDRDQNKRAKANQSPDSNHPFHIRSLRQIRRWGLHLQGGLLECDRGGWLKVASDSTCGYLS